MLLDSFAIILVLFGILMVLNIAIIAYVVRAMRNIGHRIDNLLSKFKEKYKR